MDRAEQHATPHEDRAHQDQTEQETSSSNSQESASTPTTGAAQTTTDRPSCSAAANPHGNPAGPPPPIGSHQGPAPHPPRPTGPTRLAGDRHRPRQPNRHLPTEVNEQTTSDKAGQQTPCAWHAEHMGKHSIAKGQGQQTIGPLSAADEEAGSSSEEWYRQLAVKMQADAECCLPTTHEHATKGRASIQGVQNGPCQQGDRKARGLVRQAHIPAAGQVVIAGFPGHVLGEDTHRPDVRATDSCTFTFAADRVALASPTARPKFLTISCGYLGTPDIALKQMSEDEVMLGACLWAEKFLEQVRQVANEANLDSLTPDDCVLGAARYHRMISVAIQQGRLDQEAAQAARKTAVRLRFDLFQEPTSVMNGQARHLRHQNASLCTLTNGTGRQGRVKGGQSQQICTALTQTSICAGKKATKSLLECTRWTFLLPFWPNCRHRYWRIGAMRPPQVLSPGIVVSTSHQSRAQSVMQSVACIPDLDGWNAYFLQQLHQPAKQFFSKVINFDTQVQLAHPSQSRQMQQTAPKPDPKAIALLLEDPPIKLWDTPYDHLNTLHDPSCAPPDCVERIRLIFRTRDPKTLRCPLVAWTLPVSDSVTRMPSPSAQSRSARRLPSRLRHSPEAEPTGELKALREAAAAKAHFRKASEEWVRTWSDNTWADTTWSQSSGSDERWHRTRRIGVSGLRTPRSTGRKS